MFVSGGQFYVFVATIAFGATCGVLFSLSCLIKYKIRNIFLRIIPDLLAFIITATLYVLYSSLMNFPSFRAYMVVGVISGIIIYFKSFHILLAKCAKKLYNLSIKLFKDNTKDGRIKS